MRQVGGILLWAFLRIRTVFVRFLRGTHIIRICPGASKCVFVWVRLSHIKASCHWLPNIRQAPVFWHPLRSLPFSTTSHDQISGIHDLSIQLSHKLASFARPVVFSSFSVIFLSWSFLPFPWRDRGMFLCCKMAARWMSFVQSAPTFICPSITLSKGYEMQLRNLKTFHWGT